MSDNEERIVLFSCVTEGDPEWLPVVQRLVLSVREFGGSCRTAPFIVNFVGEVPTGAALALSELGAETRCVEPMQGHGPANKLRMFDLHDSFKFDVLVALDCDTVVLADPTPHLPFTAIGAKSVDYDPFTQGDWRRLYRALGIAPSQQKLRATSTGKEIPPYFNSGVLTVPRALCEPLQREWRSAHTQVAAALERDRQLIPRPLYFFADQISLALCMARSSLPVSPLPVTMNFPSHVPVHRSALPDDPRPVILHYHDAVDDRGFLYWPRSTVAGDRANAFNRAHAARLGISHSGLRPKPLVSRLAQMTADRFWWTVAVGYRFRFWLGGMLSRVRSPV